MIAALLLLAVGLGDVARRALSGWLQFAVGIAVAAAVLVGVGLPLSLPPTQLVSAGAVAMVWMLALRFADDRASGLWPALLLFGSVALGAVVGPWPDASALLPTGVGFSGFDARVALTVVAVGVWLTSSANLVIRALLAAARGADPLPLPRTTARWVVLRGRRRPIVIERQDGSIAAAAPSAGALLGGRIIGPLERLLIVLLALIGAPVLIAALIAAKGIVRYPEISADRGAGSKAEEFLIGSLTSWALAGVGVVLVIAAQNA